MKTKERVTKRGFTLIELLVVIAILAILASILFPVFARARENAKRASCWSNMKQVSQACVMYAQDYDEWLPIGTDPIQWSTYRNPKLGLVQAIYPYVKARPVFYCPSADATSQMNMSGNAAMQAWAKTLPNTNENWNVGNIAYYYYSFLVSQPGQSGLAPPYFAARILSLRDDSPSERWLMSDVFSGSAQFPHGFAAGTGVHVSYLDGHVSPMVHGKPVENYK